MSEAAQNVGAIIVGVIILLALLLRFAASGGTMRRKDCEANAKRAIQMGQARKAREQAEQAAAQWAWREWQRTNRGEGGNR